MKIEVIIEIELVFPYALSMGVLSEFCHLWNCHLVSGGTKKLKATISMPVHQFKKIFGDNPQVREYPVPARTDKFISK